MPRPLAPARALAALVLVTVSVSASFAEGAPERIRFARGSTSATVRGHIDGFGYRDYVIRANEGQRMSVRLASKNIYAQFVVLTINGRATDDVERVEWADTLRETGDYVIRVLMVRAGARRKGAAADYALTVAIV